MAIFSGLELGEGELEKIFVLFQTVEKIKFHLSHVDFESKMFFEVTLLISVHLQLDTVFQALNATYAMYCHKKEKNSKYASSTTFTTGGPLKSNKDDNNKRHCCVHTSNRISDVTCVGQTVASYITTATLA